MKTKVKKISDSRVEITVTLDAKDLKAACEKAIERLAKEVKVEGFRKGKVPTKVAEKFIPENDINATAIDIAVRTTVIEAFQKESKSPLVVPNVNVTKYVPNESAEYVATADIIPEIKLGGYKQLKVKKPAVKVTKKDVDEILNNLANSFAEKKVVKREAKLNDEVVIDFVGKKDDEAFDGGSAKDYKLVLGSETFIPGFEDFLKANGKNLKEWEKEARELAEMRVKASLVLQTLAVEEKIKVADEEVAAKIAELKDVYKNSAEALKSLKNPNVKMEIKNRMIIEKTLEFLAKENEK